MLWLPRGAVVQLSIRAKFLIVTVLIVVGVDLAAGSYLQWRLRGEHNARIEAELSAHARTVAILLEAEPRAWTVETIDPWADQLGGAMDARVTIIDPAGVVVGDSEVLTEQVRTLDNHGRRPEILAAGSDTCGLSRRHSDTLKTDMLYCAMVLDDGLGFVRVAMPLRTVDDAIRRLRVAVALAGLIAVLLATIIALVASRVVSETVEALMEAAQAVADEDGPSETTSLAGSITRVSRKLERTVAELAAERNLFETVLQSMQEAVLAVDDQRRIVVINRAAQDLLGISKNVRGRPLLEVVRIPQLSDAVDASLAGESSKLRVQLSVGTSVLSLMVRSTPRKEAGGAVVVIHDVTEIRRLETVRRDFVANVSHELRTPVSVIAANTETLLLGALNEPEAAERFLSAIHRNATRLDRLISDLLDISRIEAGKYALEIRPLALGEVIDVVERAVLESCEQRGATLESSCDPDLLVRADPHALEQILVNLIVNAVKYGPEGGTVELATAIHEGHVRIEVRDRGPGIAPDHRSRVFERFYRVDPGRSRHMGGTGLGLAIVKNLTEAMGGEVGVDPREPVGSVFWVQLCRGDVD